MKNSFERMLVFILSAVMFINIIPVKAVEEMNDNSTEIYVSPIGSDENSGTLESPLKTLAAAREAARNRLGSTEIVLRGGEYNLTETLVLDKRDSNTKWTNYNDEVPVVTSERTITGWSMHDSEKNIYKAKVDEGFTTRQLYFNGEKAKRSRSISYKGGYSNLDRTCELGLNSRNNKEFYFYRDEVENWNNFEDVELHLLTAWVDNVFRLKKYDENNNFINTTVDNGGEEGIADAVAVKIQDTEAERIFNRAHPDITGTTRGYASRSYYYFENAYEFIDEDTEWYLDKTDSTIYFKAPEGTDMEKAVFTVPTLETLVKIEGTKEEKASNITFENIVFECTTWIRPSEEGLVGAQACQYALKTTLDNETWAYHPPSGFFAVYADNLLVQGCTFRKMGAVGLDYYVGVTNSQIFGNNVYDIASNGISVAKFVQDEETEYHIAYNPADKSEITRNIDVINNTVHHIGTEYEGAVGIIAGYPEHIVIAHNDIYSAPYSGISVGFGWSSDDNAMKNNIIFANKIYDIGQVLCDFGAIYTLSKQPGSVCARNYINSVTGKLWFDYGYAAMYFDEQTEGYTICENLMCNIGQDAWGGGINFNGCAGKNSKKNNYINVSVNTNETTMAVEKQAGVLHGADCTELKEEAENYLFDILNPKEPYDETDYYIYSEISPVRATATAVDASSSGEYAIDKNHNTAYTLSGQTAENIDSQYLLIELDGKSVVDRIKIERQYNAGGVSDNNYWADWCLAVGCELQGSSDGETWETVGVMNTWPDGTGEMSEDIFELENPKAYKYIRYIRTKYKTGSDYAVWRWSSTDGGNRLNVKEISFYSKKPAESIDIVGVTATACDEGSNPNYAVDKNPATVYTLSAQTENSINDQYLMLETDGKREIEKIIIRRQYNAANTNDNNYWADWCLAVGCELQGSFDGKNWETVGIMNTWPDGTGEKTKEIFELEKPKAYKYIRYIRTKYKTGSDYAVWRWSSTDGGNRLNVKEIELYTSQTLSISNVEKAGDSININLENVFETKGVLLVASYKGDALAGVSVSTVKEGKTEYSVPFVNGAEKVKVMILELENIEPLCKECEIDVEG
ncbi:MAG: discoidin domain-containing protein [Clostridia bacterium]